MSQLITVITGARGGIGAATAQRWQRDHPEDTLVCTDLQVPKGADAGQALAGQSNGPEWVACDISNEEDVENLFAQVASRGTLARLIHVAGVFSNTELADTATEDFDRIMRVNVRGGFFVLRAAARLLREQTDRLDGDLDRSITVVASNAAGVPRWGMAAYGASKAALSQLTRTAGLELAQYGVRCNVLCPGATETDMQRAFWGDDPQAGRHRSVAGDLAIGRLGIPLGRMGQPEDIAAAAAFVASPAARYVNLQEIYVDGGATQHA